MQDGKSFLYATSSIDDHDSPSCVKLTLIIVCILLGHTQFHQIIGRVCTRSFLTGKQALETVQKTTGSAFCQPDLVIAKTNLPQVINGLVRSIAVCKGT